MEDSTTHQDPTPPRGVVRFLTSEFDALVEPHGYTSNVKKARLVKCGVATMSRLRNGLQNPGPSVIAGVFGGLRGLPGAPDPSTVFDFDGGEN